MFKRVVLALAGVVFTALGLVVVFGGLEAARRYREARNVAQGGRVGTTGPGGGDDGDGGAVAVVP